MAAKELSALRIVVYNKENILRKKENYLKRSSHGFKPVCFLNAVLKCEIEEYPSKDETSVTFKPFSYKRYFACSIL